MSAFLAGCQTRSQCLQRPAQYKGTKYAPNHPLQKVTVLRHRWEENTESMLSKRQISFTEAESHGKKRGTRRQRFLTEMESVVPWSRQIAAVESYSYYPKGKRGRPPIGLERMLRIYFVQQWYGLSDEALYNSMGMRAIAGIDLAVEAVPDATTLLKFRRLLVEHELTRKLFDEIGIMLIGGASENGKYCTLSCHGLPDAADGWWPCIIHVTKSRRSTPDRTGQCLPTARALSKRTYQQLADASTSTPPMPKPQQGRPKKGRSRLGPTMTPNNARCPNSCATAR